jgi:hypothetical protein
MKDLTKIKTPFGTLRRKIRTALQAHFDAGGAIEFMDGGDWKPACSPQWLPNRAYRAKPTGPIIGSIVLSAEYRGVFVGVQARAQSETQPHPIFAAVKEWQEAGCAMRGNREKLDIFAAHARMQAAFDALMAIKVPE